MVVLYNPEEDCIQNINSYLHQVSLLIIVDNSDYTNTTLLNELISNPKVKYIANNTNLGIAHALNQAATIVKKDDYDFLLTMDQDSSADSNLIENYNYFLLSNDFSKIGILAPVPSYIPETSKENVQSVKELDVAITSGCLLNLSVYEKSGPFKDDLFIDYVDFEYCLRLKKKGFKIVQISKAKIYHQLGNLEKHHFIFKPIYVTHHLPIRYYYRTRNRLFVAKKYILSFPAFVLKDFFIFINEILKIIFLENNKCLKIKRIIRGLMDYIKNKYGKFENIHK